ncbi:MAG: heat-shock protein [Armatimonadota bacterium]
MPWRKDEQWLQEMEGHLGRFSAVTVRHSRVAVRKAWEPRVDVFEEVERIVVRAETPGVSPGEVQVTYLPARHVLTIAGRRREEPSERTHVHLLEILYGEFEREVLLPDVGIDPEGIVANFRDGLLTVTLPKQALGGHRQISVEACE